MRLTTTFICLLALTAPLVVGSTDEEKELRYVNLVSENLRKTPKGLKLGTLAQGTQLTVLEDNGGWIKVSVEGWIWKASTTDKPPSVSTQTSTSSKPALELVDFRTKHLPADINVPRFSAEVILTLIVKNNTSKRIKAWRAVATIKSSFGDVLIRAQLTDGTANLGPGRTAEASFSWEENQFIDDEPFDKLVAYSKENLRVSLSEVKLSQ